MTLKYLKDTAIKWVDEQFRHPARKMQWIVTVPAIWSETAKAIMRSAAEKVYNLQNFVMYIPLSWNGMILYLITCLQSNFCMKLSCSKGALTIRLAKVFVTNMVNYFTHIGIMPPCLYDKLDN